MRYKVHYSCITHTGYVRKMNQDNFVCEGRYLGDQKARFSFPLRGEIHGGKYGMIGVFDGMGGEQCGEVASFLASQRASEVLLGKNLIRDLEEFCKEANQTICKYAEQNQIFSMGTTAAVLAFGEKEIGLCNIGDSKIFRFAEGKLEQISVDHVGIGAYGRKPPLSQNLGIPESEFILDPHLAIGQYGEGDIYLLCSDGLTDMVEEKAIASVLEEIDFEQAAEVLQNKALASGGKDNITIILCKIECEKKTLWDKVFG